MDMIGKVLVNKQPDFNNNDIKIPVHSLSKGIYVLRVIQDNNVQSIKFIKE